MRMPWRTKSANTDNIIAENAEISRLVATVEKVQLQAEGSDNSYSIRFASLYAAGAIDDALRLNEEEMARTEEETEHSRLYYDRGLIYELAFDWFAAYMAFQRAWDGERRTRTMGCASRYLLFVNISLVRQSLSTRCSVRRTKIRTIKPYCWMQLPMLISALARITQQKTPTAKY